MGDRFESFLTRAMGQEEGQHESQMYPKCSNHVQLPNVISPTLFPPIWRELRNNALFCDTTICCSDGISYKVHKIILVAMSTYFKALFTSSLTSSNLATELNWPSAVVAELIEFMYSGECNITHDNVEQLLSAADYLAVIPLVGKCCLFLASHTTPANCWGVYRYAITFSCSELVDFTMRFILFNFAPFFNESPEFVEIDLINLTALLSNDLLNANEYQVYEAIEKWVNFDYDNRVADMALLFGCIRFNVMSSEYYRTILNSPLIIQNIPKGLMTFCSRLVETGGSSRRNRRLHRSINPSESREWSSSVVTRPRVPYQVLFAIAGWTSGAPTNYIETYDIRADRWFLCMQTDTIARAYHSTVCVNNLIYVIGGFDGSTHFNTVRCYDPVAKVWTEKACMYQSRCYVCAVYLEGYIYAIGGFNGRARMSSVERYNISCNQWEMISPMNMLRSDAGATVHNRTIFVAGGFNGEDVLQSVEMYSLETEQWTVIQSLFEPRSGVSLVTYCGEIYALGGFNGMTRLRSGEKLDPERKEMGWSGRVPDMFTPRSNFSCVVFNDRIYVIGGYNGTSTVPFVECYHRDNEDWEPVASMRLNRSALSTVVLSGLPNAVDYTYNASFHARTDKNSGATGDSVH